ncbi:MAG: putative toxin-antitoxin system toxin component, PIN family [Hymenobacter sp.]|nr:MAG: putative toxin-antitoxin system toxin component, PIN family [Hymenobacter sp.]
MRLVLDTNVLVSSLIQRSYPYYLLDRVLADPGLHPCLSEPLLAEYIEVLNRPKFSRFPDFQARAHTLLADLESQALRFVPTEQLRIIADAPDNRLLELAAASQAAYLITGNTSDFTMPEFQGTRIVSPREFFELLR